MKKNLPFLAPLFLVAMAGCVHGQPSAFERTISRFMDSVKSERVRAGVKSEAAEVADNRVDTKEAKETAASVAKTA